MSAPREALRVFLRVPEPGRAKTRLIPALGPEGAAAVYRRVAQRALDEARRLSRPALERLAFVAPDEGVPAGAASCSPRARVTWASAWHRRSRVPSRGAPNAP